MAQKLDACDLWEDLQDGTGDESPRHGFATGMAYRRALSGFRGVMQDSGHEHSDDTEGQRLFLDNLKLWDCLALFRSEPNMSTATATRIVFGLSDAEYFRAFPESNHILAARRPLGVDYTSQEEYTVEKLRLSEENARLHAVLWVLRDNPSLQVDSTLASVFRLDHAHFFAKFPYNTDTGTLYRAGSYRYNHRNNNKNDRRAGQVLVPPIRGNCWYPPADSLAIHHSNRPFGPPKLWTRKHHISTGHKLHSSRKQESGKVRNQNVSSNRTQTQPAVKNEMHAAKETMGVGPNVHGNEKRTYAKEDEKHQCEPMLEILTFPKKATDAVMQTPLQGKNFPVAKTNEEAIARKRKRFYKTGGCLLWKKVPKKTSGNSQRMAGVNSKEKPQAKGKLYIQNKVADVDSNKTDESLPFLHLQKDRTEIPQKVVEHHQQQQDTNVSNVKNEFNSFSTDRKDSKLRVRAFSNTPNSSKPEEKEGKEIHPRQTKGNATSSSWQQSPHKQTNKNVSIGPLNCQLEDESLEREFGDCFTTNASAVRFCADCSDGGAPDMVTHILFSAIPAPAVSSINDPYPHKSYTSEQQFSDRHRRVYEVLHVKRPTEVFTREKTPSVAMLIEHDYLGTRMNNRVLTPKSSPLSSFGGVLAKKLLEKWPVPECALIDIFHHKSTTRHSTEPKLKQLVGHLRGCDRKEPFNILDDLKILKSMGRYKYVKPIRDIIRSNYATWEDHASKRKTSRQ